jgi:redoxin
MPRERLSGCAAGPFSRSRRARLPAVKLVVSLAVLAALAAAPQVRLRTLDDKPIDPFQAAAGTKAHVFVFVSVDCPISNRYAPEVRRLHERYSPQGVAFSLVYPNPVESADTIRKHLKDFSYPMRGLRDPRHDLVKASSATITPEAAVYDGQGRLLYHGRIDDRYVSLGLERPVATKRDLDEVLNDVVAGRPVRQASAQAVGCYIADFVH